MQNAEHSSLKWIGLHDELTFLDLLMMTKQTRPRHFLSATIALLLLSGCENNFSPKGDYHQQLVVYSILSSRSDSQYVRVYTTYDVAGYDPAAHATDTEVRGATVTMTDDSTTYTFKETTISRDDTGRYKSDVIAYLAAPLRLRPGKSYSLNVTSVEGPASGTVSVPGRGYVYSNLISALKNPSIKEDIPVTLGISPGAKGYLVRLYLDVVVYEGQTARDRRFEVPIAGDSMGSWAQFLYPALTRRPPDPAFMYLNFVFPHRMYAAFDNALTNQYSGYTPKRAIFILTQVDPGLYNYYKLANGFLDSYSVRMDQPDYTNIKGGLGVFGAMVEDSMVVDLQ